jgi:hypothetical protein
MNVTTRKFSCALICLLVFLPCLDVLGNPGSALDVGSRKQLFNDHNFIQSTEGVDLTMNSPLKTGQQLITADAPWEKELKLGRYSTLIEENGLIRVWYNILEKKAVPRQYPDIMALAYAEF